LVANPTWAGMPAAWQRSGSRVQPRGTYSSRSTTPCPAGLAYTSKTATWAFSTRPAVPVYWRWTPTVWAPFLRSPVSSTTSTAWGRRGARPGSRGRHRGPRGGPTPPAPAAAASHPGWRPRHARRSSSSSCVAGPKAAHARTPRRGGAVPPAGTGPRPGPAAPPALPASGQGLRLRCGRRPPSDLRLCAQHRIINGGRPALPTRPPEQPGTIYGWSTNGTPVPNVVAAAGQVARFRQSATPERPTTPHPISSAPAEGNKSQSRHRRPGWSDGISGDQRGRRSTALR
jgi:hypothetical protein